jgi:hypothetical protein
MSILTNSNSTLFQSLFEIFKPEGLQPHQLRPQDTPYNVDTFQDNANPGFMHSQELSALWVGPNGILAQKSGSVDWSS